MQKVIKTALKIACFVLLSVLIVFTALIDVYGVTYASAEVDSGSAVLDDLNKAENFDVSYYPEGSPEDKNYYSLDVIQIAESTDKELLIYVYQPSGQAKSLTASSINISRTIDDAISYYNFKLTLLNSNGVFFKYRVDNLTVFSTDVRYYVISAIYRPFDKTIDKQADNNNVVTEVDYKVGKQYCFGKLNGKDICNVVEVETIEITDKFVGFVRYSDGHNWWGYQWPSCDSHFVAFNTDKPIDRLLEADVYYSYQSCHSGTDTYDRNTNEFVKVFGDKQDGYAYLTYDQKVEHTGEQWGAGTYKWKRIETVEDFIAENDLTQNVYSGAIIDVNVANKITDEGKEALKGKKWLLRFVETDYLFESEGSMAHGTYKFKSDTTNVGDVTILRLKFEYDGLTYNLGTVDNKQTGSGNAINVESIGVELSNIGKVLFGILLLILVIVLISLFKPVKDLFVFIFKALVYVIKLPFKLISSLFKRRK